MTNKQIEARLLDISDILKLHTYHIDLLNGNLSVIKRKVIEMFNKNDGLLEEQDKQVKELINIVKEGAKRINLLDDYLLELKTIIENSD